MKKIFAIIFAVVVPVVAFVSNVSAENYLWNNDGYRTITQIYPDSDFQFYLSGITIDISSSCANRFVIWNTDPNYEVQVASLLAAF